jgi:hypothetical protein
LALVLPKTTAPLQGIEIMKKIEILEMKSSNKIQSSLESVSSILYQTEDRILGLEGNVDILEHSD